MAPRITSIESAHKLNSDADKSHEWPEHIKLPLDKAQANLAVLYFKEMSAFRVYDSWCSIELSKLANLSVLRTMQDQDIEYLTKEGSLVTKEGSKGQKITVRNPRIDCISSYSAVINQIEGKLGLSTPQSTREAAQKAGKIQASVRDTRADNADGLLA